MWSDTALTSLLKIDYPIVQAPMILQKPLIPLASAVSNSGGLGSLGCAEMDLAELEQRIDEMVLMTSKPFNLNFFLHQLPEFDETIDQQVRQLVSPYFEKLGLDWPSDASQSGLATFDNNVLDLLMLKRPGMVSFHFGCPSDNVVEKLKSCGIVTAATATTVDEALAIQSSGLDFIVAQGWEAGGHRGSFQSNHEDIGTGTMALVPQIVDAVSIPVIAAGGIADGRGIVAALSLGAVGVWMGTAFLTCYEAPITPLHRDALLNARDDDTCLSRAFSGRPCRARKTPYSDSMKANRSEFPEFPLMYHYSSPIKKYGIERNDLDYQFLLYGQAASLNRNSSVKELIGKLCIETQEKIRSLT